MALGRILYIDNSNNSENSQQSGNSQKSNNSQQINNSQKNNNSQQIGKLDSYNSEALSIMLLETLILYLNIVHKEEADERLEEILRDYPQYLENYRNYRNYREHREELLVKLRELIELSQADSPEKFSAVLVELVDLLCRVL